MVKNRSTIRYADIFDILKILECASTGAESTYYHKHIIEVRPAARTNDR